MMIELQFGCISADETSAFILLLILTTILRIFAQTEESKLEQVLGVLGADAKSCTVRDKKDSDGREVGVRQKEKARMLTPMEREGEDGQQVGEGRKRDWRRWIGGSCKALAAVVRVRPRMPVIN